MRAERVVKRHRPSNAQILREREPALINLPIPIPSNIPILSPILDPLVAGVPLSELLDPSATLPPLISLPLPTPHTTTQPQPAPTSPPPQTTPTPTPVSTPPATSSAPIVTNSPSPAPPPQTTSSPHASDTPAPKPPATQPEPEPEPAMPPPNPPATQPAPQSPTSPTASPVPAPTQSSAPNPNNGGGNNDQKPPGNNTSGNEGNNGSHATSAHDGSTPDSNTSLIASAATHSSPDAGVSPSPVSLAGSKGGASASTSGHTSLSLLPTATVLDGASTIVSFTLPNGQAIPVPTQKAVADAGGDSTSGTSDEVHFTATSSTITFSASGASSTGVSGGSSGGNGGDGSGGGQNDGNGMGGGSGASSASHHGLSKAIIAAVAVVGALVLFALIVLACRRRSISKRLSRRKRWYGTTSIYGAVSSSGYFRQNQPPRSERSSFATTYEHNPDPFCATPVPLTPDWPLYNGAEMSQSEPGTVTIPSAAATTYSLPSPTLRNGDRSSQGSYTSMLGSSEGHSQEGQVLLVPARGAYGDDLPTPISVRPFSPSERWSFPQPPSTTPRHSYLQPPPRTTSTSPDSATTGYVTAPDTLDDPFADGAALDSEDGHTTTETFVTASTAAAHFSAVETVRRAFAPTRADELAVEPGDRVHVVRRYDDGWAFAQNLGTGARGLFPIDCLREAGQDLNTFLAEKRLSSYKGLKEPFVF